MQSLIEEPAASLFDARACDEPETGSGHVSQIVSEAEHGAVLSELSQLRGQVERLLRFFELTPIMFWTADADGNATLCSQMQAERFGVQPTVITLAMQSQFIHPDDRPHAMEIWSAAMRDGVPYDIEVRMGNAGLDWHWVRMRSFPELKNGKAISWFGISESVHQRRVAEDKLKSLQTRLTRALDGSGVGVWEWNRSTNKVWLSDSVFSLAGFEEPRSVDTMSDFLTFIHPEDREAFRLASGDCADGRIGTFQCEIRIRTRSGWLWVLSRGSATTRDESQTVTGIAGTLTVITERKIAEEHLRWTLNHDSLTGLPNRTLILELLEATLLRNGHARHDAALVLLDVDRFKEVNDAYGHDAGDALLVALAKKLSSLVGPNDYVARLGGDEFLIVLTDPASEAAVIEQLEAICGELREPFAYADRQLDCRASIGVTMFPDHGRDAATLLKNADLAMYAAKAAGRGAVAMFTPALRHAVEARVATRLRTHAALVEGRFEPYYQGKVDLRTGEIVGLEALMRRSLGVSMVSAYDASSVHLDDNDLAVAMGEHMLDRVIADILRWRRIGVVTGPVAVNASAAEFERGDYAPRLLDRLDAAGLEHEALQIEVTETVFLGRGADKVKTALERLRAEGIKIALDDFGTGFASLAHLKHFPVDILKIDRSFVTDVTVNPGDAAIVGAILQLGRGFKVDVIAEGIETEAQRRFLMNEGCRLGQGFLFHRPASADAVAQSLSCPPTMTRLLAM